MDIDLNYRPASYFWPHSLETHLLSSVKGTERQRHIRRLIDQGRMRELDDWIAAESLSDDTRAGLGRIHPSLMGGEYLPNLRHNEVEIARISLQSVTGDVISVRATKGKQRIYYRIVDEYNTPHGTRSSIRPLTLHQLEAFIEIEEVGMRLVHCSWDGDEAERFIAVTSPFYAELDALYEKRIVDWFAELKAEREEEEAWARENGHD